MTPLVHLSSMPPPLLVLRLLGTPEIELDSQSVTSQLLTKSQALLFYLALTQQPQTRSALTVLLWGDSPQEAAQASLRQALANLREVVEPFLGIDRRTVTLRGETSLWTDAVVFEKHLAQALAQQELSEIEAILQLYQGDFLTGFSVRGAPDFDRWLYAEQERLRQLTIQGLETLATAKASQGQLEAAMGHERRVLALEPWREEAHRRLMLLLARSGQRSVALAQYEACRRVLAEELGVEPSAETVALYERIRSAPSETATPMAALPTSSTVMSLPASHNLPRTLQPLIGRQQEVATALSLLRQDETWLVTMSGPGGSGKTRLALEVAARLVPDFAHGVFFVDLAPIQDPGFMVPTIFRTLGLQEKAGQSLMETLRDYLRDKRLLLVLDNFEQIVAAAPLLAELARKAPGLVLLVTSRTHLRLRGEKEMPVPPLPLPEEAAPLAQVSQAEAVQFFVARVQEVQPGFSLTESNVATVVKLCRHLDGLPLALELAAIRTKVFGPAALLERLADPLTVLTRGARDLPDRQQTLRATIAWSVVLLTPAQQALFRRLAVFRGSFSLEGLVAVCQELNGQAQEEVLDGLTVLVDHHLVRPATSGDAHESRFTMLETIRSFAQEQLNASGEGEFLRNQHALYYLALAEEANAKFGGTEQAMWLARLETEHDNLRAALEWYATVPDGVETGLQLANALGTFWRMRGYLSEGRRWLDAFLSRVGAGVASETQVDAIITLARITLRQSNFPAAQAYFEQALLLARQIEYDEGMQSGLSGLGITLWELGDFQSARTQLEEAIRYMRPMQHTKTLVRALNNLGLVCMHQGDIKAARAYLEECLTITQQLGDKTSIATALYNLAMMAGDSGDDTGAHLLYQEALHIAQDIGDHSRVADVLNNLGSVAVRQGDFAAAIPYFDEARQIYLRLGSIGDTAYVSANLAELAFYTGDYREARRHNQEALALFREASNQRLIARVLGQLGRLACREGDMATAATLCAEALTIRRTIGHKAGMILELDQGYVELALAVGQPTVAARFLGAVAAARQSLSRPRSPMATRQTESLLVSLRAQLSDAAFTMAFAEGEAMTLEEAAAYALDTFSHAPVA